jgi:hypothetical protein
MDGARLAGTEVPDWLLDLAYELTRYSGMARYEAPLLPAGTLDRQATDAWLRQVREWATAAILDREPRLGQELEKMNALAQADR